jgi:hypothetical protein
MKEWLFYTNVRILNTAGDAELVCAYSKLGSVRGAARVPVILKETDGGLLLSREAVVGRFPEPAVLLMVTGISAAEVELAAFYRDIYFLRGGDVIEPVDLSPQGLTTARHYFEARAAGKLDFFGRPRVPSYTVRRPAGLDR